MPASVLVHVAVLVRRLAMHLLEVQLQLALEVLRLAVELGDLHVGELARGVALHSRQVTLTHPVRRTPLSVAAPLPPSWPDGLDQS